MPARLTWRPWRSSPGCIRRRPESPSMTNRRAASKQSRRCGPMSSGLPRCLTSVVGRTRKHPTCRTIERNDMDLLGVKIGAELLPIGRREAQEAVDLLDEQHVVGPGVGDEPKQFWPRQLRSRHTFPRYSSHARRRTIRLRLGRGSHLVHRSKRGDRSERPFELPSI